MIPTSIDGTDITGATIDGTDVTEITVDGQTVFSAGPPPSVIAQYEFENNGDTSTATDSIGSNNMTISGSGMSFDSNIVKVGSFSLGNDGSNPATESNNSLNIASDGTSNELTIAGFVYPDSTGRAFLFGWANDNNNFLYATIDETGSNELDCYLQILGTNTKITSGIVPSSQWYHIAVTVNNTDLKIYVDGTEENSTTHGGTPNDMGVGEYVLGERRDQNRRFFDGYWDNITFANAELSQPEIQQLADAG